MPIAFSLSALAVALCTAGQLCLCMRPCACAAAGAHSCACTRSRGECRVTKGPLHQSQRKRRARGRRCACLAGWGWSGGRGGGWRCARTRRWRRASLVLDWPADSGARRSAPRAQGPAFWRSCRLLAPPENSPQSLAAHRGGLCVSPPRLPDCAADKQRGLTQTRINSDRAGIREYTGGLTRPNGSAGSGYGACGAGEPQLLQGRQHKQLHGARSPRRAPGEVGVRALGASYHHARDPCLTLASPRLRSHTSLVALMETYMVSGRGAWVGRAWPGGTRGLGALPARANDVDADPRALLRPCAPAVLLPIPCRPRGPARAARGARRLHDYPVVAEARRCRR